MKNKALIKTTIYMVAFLLLGTYAISPAMSAISAAMPERSATEIQMIMQLPSLMSIPFLLFGGIVARKISRKILLIVGLTAYLLGGLTGFFTESYILIVISRCVLGFGIGVMNPCTMGLISDLFYGTDDYAPTVGLENASKSIGGVVYTLITGWLCLLGWHYTFLVYLMGVPVLLFLLFFVPNVTPAKEQKAETRAKSRINIPAALIIAMVSAFLASFCTNITNGNVSYLIEDSGFGNSTISGYAASAFTLFCVAGSAIYAKLTDRLGGKALPVGLVTAGAGLFAAGLSVNVVMAFAGIALLGAGCGIINPSLMMLVGRIDRKNSALYFSIILASMNLGSTIQGLVVPTIGSKLFGGNGVGASAYLVGGIIMIITIIWAILTGKKLSNTDVLEPESK